MVRAAPVAMSRSARRSDRRRKEIPNALENSPFNRIVKLRKIGHAGLRLSRNGEEKTQWG
jgi:hypothetical protein